MAFQKTLALLALLYSADVYGNTVRFEELYCLAKNIYFESRNQPKIGKIAVAQVTLNRVQSDKFPNTVCEVIYQGGERRNRCQFSWYCDGKKDEPTNGPAWDDSVYLALLVYGDGFLDVTEGALWYHATYVSPSWAEHYQKTVRINNHIFYR
tara:strand:+ start:72 stop:527 length:456 start_codon:yes stop_codon:yes gene_type:complete